MPRTQKKWEVIEEDPSLLQMIPNIKLSDYAVAAAMPALFAHFIFVRAKPRMYRRPATLFAAYLGGLGGALYLWQQGFGRTTGHLDNGLPVPTPTTSGAILATSSTKDDTK
eukprot:CAMPEP_0113936848 /NCGR_PEP_ID=MMETSP1339-20121228/3620_1 /TAXON_ID=94617 /ORGANISM="Fibrocapsa japonica" /LENGTH=110 /DNA_ID=CAMNT_0000939411 /DNA_START=122 /DNA_END=454 /DNA_ORIENTATION=+ /assembly_acc=CAM_ASM_000762